jgi:TPR repeat protein
MKKNHLAVFIVLFILSSCASMTQSYNYFKLAQKEHSKQNYKKALYFFKKSARSGNASAMFQLGFIYNHGDGVAKNSQAAFYWYKKSAEYGDVAGMFNLGCMYNYGQGTPVNLKQAKYWYEKASKLGYTPALYNYVKLLES